MQHRHRKLTRSKPVWEGNTFLTRYEGAHIWDGYKTHTEIIVSYLVIVLDDLSILSGVQKHLQRLIIIKSFQYCCIIDSWYLLFEPILISFYWRLFCRRLFCRCLFCRCLFCWRLFCRDSSCVNHLSRCRIPFFLDKMIFQTIDSCQQDS